MLTGIQRAIALQSHSNINLNVLGKKIKVNTTGASNRLVKSSCQQGQDCLLQETYLRQFQETMETKVLHRSHGTTLPTIESSKSLSDHFATFFSNKIMKVHETFSSSESCNMVHPHFDPPHSLPYIVQI